MDEKELIKKRILSLKKEKKAVILAHNYQIPDIQDISDFTGDSLELAKIASGLNCEIIIFCGVDFMAETAAILAPDKKVILPASDAHCPMAEMVTAGEVKCLKERFLDVAVVAYVNTSAEVKAESDICCTSANAVSVVNSLEEERVIFLPDRNLASYVGGFTKKEILPWEGFCIVHDMITAEMVHNARAEHPCAEIIVHPECRSEVAALSDGIFSTSGMIRHACESKRDEFVIGTETGLLYQLYKKCPDKKFYPLSKKAVCANMKKTGLNEVLSALIYEEPIVTVNEKTALKAKEAIERMFEVS